MLKNNFKNILKNKNTVTILGVVLCLVILYVGYSIRINQRTALVDVFYANQTIQPKTLITADMVSKTSVPASFIKGSYYKNYDDIVGKYSNYNTMIANGSIFYTDLLIEESSLPDGAIHKIREGDKLVSYTVDTKSTYGNSIMPGNLVDIYVKILNNNNKVVYGELMNQVEVLAVKDIDGKDVFEKTDEVLVPAYLYFGLPENKYLLFSALNYIKDEFKEYNIEIVFVPNTIDYEDKTATQVSSTYLYNFVIDNIEKIDNQEDLYNNLINEIEQLEANKTTQNNG